MFEQKNKTLNKQKDIAEALRKKYANEKPEEKAGNKKCEYCAHSCDYNESILFIRCERTEHSLIVRKDFTCKHYLKTAAE